MIFTSILVGLDLQMLTQGGKSKEKLAISKGILIGLFSLIPNTSFLAIGNPYILIIFYWKYTSVVEIIYYIIATLFGCLWGQLVSDLVNKFNLYKALKKVYYQKIE